MRDLPYVKVGSETARRIHRRRARWDAMIYFLAGVGMMVLFLTMFHYGFQFGMHCWRLK